MADISTDKKLLAAAILRRESMARKDSFDPYIIGSQPTEKQQEMLEDINHYASRYVVAGNQSGKSMLGGREAAWIFSNSHPYFDSKAKWGDRPLIMLILGQTTKQIETELWGNKIMPHLEPGTYQPHSSGGVLQSVTHKKNGNKIIFMSHHNANDARKNSQAFVAQWVWLDEMPSSVSLFVELETRTIATQGKFICTFTPLIRNVQIKNKIENVDPLFGKKYRFAMLDNPIYKGREEEIAARYATLNEGERNARLYGEWYIGDRGVYKFDMDKHVENPDTYHPSWRHVEIVDPAAAGFAGYVLVAEDPTSKIWYVIKAENIKGDTATELLPQFMKRSEGVNLIHRISDPHEAWFIKEALKQKVFYRGVFNKNNNRKLELIKQLQTALDDNKLKVTDWAGESVLEQFTSCQWSETNDDKMVRASDYHILDCLQYFCDAIPKPVALAANLTWEQEIRIKHRERLVAEAKKADKPRLTFGSRKTRLHRRQP
jgi:phage terminase large subunit-like protein